MIRNIFKKLFFREKAIKEDIELDGDGNLIMNTYTIKVLDAMLIIFINENDLHPQKLQYKLLQCGFVVVLPDVKILLSYMRKQGFISGGASNLNIN